MADVFTLQGSVDVDLDRAVQDVQRVGSEADKTANKFTSMGEKLKKVGESVSNFGKEMTTKLSLPIIGAGAASFKLASDMQESLNKVNVAFKDNAQQVVDWGSTTLAQFGMSKNTALEMVSLFGDMASGMGINSKEAADMSTNLVGLAADLASYKNISTEVAQNALKGIFTGEGESLKGLGVIMNETTLGLYAMEKGFLKADTNSPKYLQANQRLKDSYAALDKARKKSGENSEEYQKALVKVKVAEEGLQSASEGNMKSLSQEQLVMLRYQYVLDKTKDAQGDFARTSDGAANQMRSFPEALKELGTTLGENLLPLFTPVITKINEIVVSFSKMGKGTQQTVLIVGAIVAAIGPLILIGGKLIALCGAISTGMGAITTATGLAAAPILAIVAGVALLVAGFIELWNTNEEFKFGIINGLEAIKQALLPCFQMIKDNADKIFSALKMLWEIFVDLLNELWYAVLQPLWDNFVYAIQGLAEIFQAVFPVLVFLFQSFAMGCKIMYEAVIKPIFSFISILVGNLMQSFRGLVDFIVGVFTGDWKRAWEGVVNIFGGIFDNLKVMAKAPLNGIIYLINQVIDGLSLLNIEIPDWIPKIGGKKFGVDIKPIKYLENGGIFTQPTMINPYTMIGERNKGQSKQAEAVIPLDRLWKEIGKIANREVVIQIDGRELMRAIAPYQGEFENFNNLHFV